MNLTDAGRESQLVVVWFDLYKREVTVDWSWGDEPQEHKTYKKRLSYYRCFRGIKKVPRGPFDPYLVPFKNTNNPDQEIGLSVGQEFYDVLPFRGIRDAICSYSVRPGVEGVPVSTDQLLFVSVMKWFSPECPARMIGEKLVIDELSGALHDVAESGVEGEAVPAPVRDRETVKAVARVEALLPEPARGHAPVGRKLPLAYIPQEMFDSGSFDGLCLGHIETYRIVRTFAKKAGGDSEFHYNQVGILQLCGLLERRVGDMLVRRKDERQREIERIRTSETSVRRYITGLIKRGLLEEIVDGRPSSPKYGPGYVSKYQVAMSESQRFKMLIERKKKGRKKKS